VSASQATVLSAGAQLEAFSRCSQVVEEILATCGRPRSLPEGVPFWCALTRWSCCPLIASPPCHHPGHKTCELALLLAIWRPLKHAAPSSLVNSPGLDIRSCDPNSSRYPASSSCPASHPTRARTSASPSQRCCRAPTGVASDGFSRQQSSRRSNVRASGGLRRPPRADSIQRLVLVLPATTPSACTTPVDVHAAGVNAPPIQSAERAALGGGWTNVPELELASRARRFSPCDRVGLAVGLGVLILSDLVLMTDELL
jgi:hypothetical protein